jgi:methionyl-tRNA formyltransferase
VKIVFFGTPEFAVPSLRALLDAGQNVVLVVAQPDRPAGRGMKLQTPPVAAFARERGIPVIQPLRIRTPEFLQAVRETSPDLGAVIAYGRILPEALLEIPRQGFLNVHGSILPKYRGAAPIQRAIESGETETGVSIMRVDAELDHGPVLEIARTSIDPDETTPELAERLSRLGAETLASVVTRMEAGPVREEEQDHSAATVAAKIEKEEGRVDWQLPAARIYNRYRAFFPWPGLFAELHGEMVKLTSIRPASASGTPGTVLEVSAEGVLVAAGEGSILIRELQRPGKRPAAAADVARSAFLKTGEHFA